MTPRSFSSLGLLALAAPSMAFAGPLELRVMPGFNGDGGRPSLIGNGPVSDGPTDEPEEEVEEPVEETPVTELSCQIEQPADYLAPVGGLLELQWDMSGYQSPELFIALYSDSQKEGGRICLVIFQPRTIVGLLECQSEVRDGNQGWSYKMWQSRHRGDIDF